VRCLLLASLARGPCRSVRIAREYRNVAVPIVIFVACFVAGAIAGTQWLPSLAAGPVGGAAFFAVCGLLGAGLGVVGLHLYSIIESPLDSHFGKVIVAGQLSDMLFQAGAVLGLGMAIYLLVPRGASRSPDAAD
jgi:hypothetical protein